MVTQITYNYGSGVEGNENFGALFDGACTAARIVDQIDEIHKFGSLTRTYPSGLPMSAVYADSFGGDITVFVNGYLIPATALPPAPRQVSDRTKAMLDR
jgi:hypothetical protein